MKRQQITERPATLKGLSSDVSHKGKTLYFYDGNELVFEIELEGAFPTKQTGAGIIPGLELDPPMFFQRSISVSKPEDDTIEFFYD